MSDDDWCYLVLFDGACGLCDRSVRWLVAHDRRRRLRYAPLQGETARAFVDEATQLDTVRLVIRDASGTRVLDRSRAAFALLGLVGGPWRILGWARVLPTALTDAVYRFVANRRRKWFGTANTCGLLPPAERALFLP